VGCFSKKPFSSRPVGKGRYAMATNDLRSCGVLLLDIDGVLHPGREQREGVSASRVLESVGSWLQG
jgi:hypothetical protein